MKKITDELLNEYIDNQLDSASLNELKEILNNDEETVAKLKALKLVDENLKNIELHKAPDGFADRIMSVISERAQSIKPNMKYFFTWIISVFGIFIAAVFVTAFIIVEKQVSASKEFKIVDTVEKFVNENISNINFVFVNNQILIAGVLLVAVLLLTGLMVIDSHRNFKNKLKSITQ